MNRKRNVSYIKPEDPDFLKRLKKQVCYDDKNHKFDELQNTEDDFADDGESEQPQVVVLKEGDLTAEEAEVEKKKIEKLESETKADLNQRVLFKGKSSKSRASQESSRWDEKDKKKHKNTSKLLSFGDDDEEEEDE